MFRRGSTPDNHVRTEIGAVRPNDGAIFDFDLFEELFIRLECVENRPRHQARNISLNHRAVTEGETQSPPLKRNYLSNSQKRHNPLTILFQRSNRLRKVSFLCQAPILIQFRAMERSLFQGQSQRTTRELPR